MNTLNASSDPRIHALSAHAYPTQLIDFESSAFFCDCGNLRVIASGGDLSEQFAPIMARTAQKSLWTDQGPKGADAKTDDGTEAARRLQRRGP